MKDRCVTRRKKCCKMLFFIHLHARRVPRNEMDEVDKTDEMDKMDEMDKRHNVRCFGSSATFFEDYVPNWLQFVNCNSTFYLPFNGKQIQLLNISHIFLLFTSKRFWGTTMLIFARIHSSVVPVLPVRNVTNVCGSLHMSWATGSFIRSWFFCWIWVECHMTW